MTKEKPWSGRFTESTDAAVEAFTASVEFDRRLYVYDIMGSIAHAQMLAKVGVLTKKESDAIIKGLKDIEAEIDTGQFEWSVALEDVHMNIEARLIQRIGETGKKLHTGRSRNDQVATDLRLYLRDGIDVVAHSLGQLQQAILDLAEREAGSPMPGFTHLQVAQPITFGHHMLAWFEMLARDAERLQDCRGRLNVMPLGSAALAGTSFPIDRAYTAKLLGFEDPSENSLDAVADRDFVIEFVADAALIMTHLSRMAEELVLWSSAQFGFVELSDAYCTGSSIMPQKKNPDVPELVRGKTGRVTGHLVALLTLMKAQPLAYNKDNQEDKEPVFDTLDTVLGSLRVFTGMITSMKVRRDHLLRSAVMGHATATDLADYLVRQGVPFRDAHEIVGKAVRLALDTDRDLSQIDLEEYKKLSPAIGKDVYGVLTVEGSLKARDHLGGTAPSQVKAAIKRARTRLKKSGP
ncbi:MAG TPA: argininosuccinate lyase [Sulfuricaulis sp.]|nr:argininosuccinate lyase [Sulfuricaulis sp.]